MSRLLKGKVAVITGAATGIGKIGAHLFGNEGAKVVIADINHAEGEKTVKEIGEHGIEAVYIRCDLGSVSEIENMVKRAAEIFGRLDIFWYNAGREFTGHIDLIKEEEYDKEMATDLKGAVFGTKLVLPEMRKIGGGCVLFTSSMVGLRPTPYVPSYPLTHMLTKAGLVMLVRSLTEPLAKDNIRINCICPGPTQTPHHIEAQRFQAHIDGVSEEELVKRSRERIPLRREMTMEEIANAALFLCSDMASAITGVALPVDGGFAAV